MNRGSIRRGSLQKIWLVRHGQSDWNKSKRVSGQLDPELAVGGRAMAERLAMVLRNEPLDTIVTSTLQRSVGTALPIARNRNIKPRQVAAFVEQNLGIAQGRFRDQRDPEIMEHWRRRDANRVGYRMPGGETFAELHQRVIPALYELLAGGNGNTALLVGHRNSLRAALGHLLGWTMRESASLRIRNKFVYEVTLKETLTVRSIRLKQDGLGTAYPGFLL